MFTMTSPRYARSVMMFVNKGRRKVILGGIILSSVLMTLRSVSLKDQTAETLSLPGLRSFIQQGEKIDAMLFQAIHRLTNGAEEKRNIIVRFVSLQDRDKVLSLGFKNKQVSSFAVVPDLPPTYYGTNCLGRGGVSLRASEGGLN